MLAEKICAGRWPQALDLPTAAGKTACIDVAIYALASQAHKPRCDLTAPRRIWFVVDRRIVMDEAFDRASAIAGKLAAAEKGPVKEIADRLRQIGGTERPLATARLRGGIFQDDGWARLPCQPAVITSTVDQLGSRLLFRGYGHSALTASIFAGLAAHDSLILLDEAHCSLPFLQTVRAIEKLRGEDWAELPIVTPFAFTILSATPPPGIPEEVCFPGSDSDAALNHPILKARMAASKPAELVLVKASFAIEDALVTEAVKRVDSYLERHGRRRVAVIVNRIGTAEKIAGLLRSHIGDAADVLLMTGAIRPYERDRLVARWKPILRASSPLEPNKPVILVSTQCIEVGADLSFDALVTEAASLDALRQRFGRLNRMGTPGAAPATILARDRDVEQGQSDPIYGTALPECWKLLTEKATSVSEEKDRQKVIDFGFDAFAGILADIEDLSLYLAPAPRAPALLPAHLDLLSQTVPAPHPQPDIDLFLHGQQGVPEARVVWRSDLRGDNAATWRETAALCPPISSEMLSVPLHRIRDWLKNNDADEEICDVEGRGWQAKEANDESPGARIPPVLIWRGRDRSEISRQASALRPNDVVILPSEYGISGLGQSVPAESVGRANLDLWEPCRVASAQTPAMRLNRAVLEPWIEWPPLKNLISVVENPVRETESMREAIDAVLQYQPDTRDEPVSPPEWLLNLLRTVCGGRVEDHPAGGVVLFARDSRSLRASEADLFADDDDLLCAAGQEVSLALHSASVERAVEKIASRCLPDEFLYPLRRAAYWHDAGKLDERFQVLLRQGDEVAAALREPLAKSASIPISPARRRTIRQAAGLPQDFRHEMLSMQLLSRHAELPEGNDGDLIQHLVASHHGYARPFAPICSDPQPPAIFGSHDGAVIELTAMDRARLVEPHSFGSGMAERFWRLTRRYGWWGLAYLEGVLRLSDWYGSQWVVNSSEARSLGVRVGGPNSGSTARTNSVVALDGLDGSNPLGFLAALGALLAVRLESCPEARLSWRRGASWQPVLSGISTTSRDMLAAAIASAISAAVVPEDAERKRLATQNEFDAAKKAVRNKIAEIKRRGLRGRERKAAIESEVGSLRQKAIHARTVWLAALRDAVPRPELAIGKHIECTADEYHELAITFLEKPRVIGRELLDFVAAFGSDGCVEKSGRISATPFCFITGSGHQYFLETVRQLLERVTSERIESALFERWTYSDETLSLRWDPIEDRRYALMDRDPTASDNKPRTVWMANLLGYLALALLPSAPTTKGLQTTGWNQSREWFTWPMWEQPADPDTIRSLMAIAEFSAATPNASAIRARGIVALFRANRVKVGSGANFKINFGPTRGV